MQSGRKAKLAPLAIVGMACRLPGAGDLEQYWELLIRGGCAITDLPPDRLDRELYYAPEKGIRNKSYTCRGAIVANQPIDFNRYPVSPALVRKADPTHRMMCQVAAEAFRHASMDPLDLPLRHTGVYVGHTLGSGLAADYDYAAGIEEAAQCLREVEPFRQLPPAEQDEIIQRLASEVRRRFAQPATNVRNLASHMAAGIVSKAFGLSGPFMAVNAACASSLQALVLAARALQRGKIDMALVGGASVCSTDWLLLFSAAQSLSATQSRPFDCRADGLIVAEGYVAVVVKTLRRALQDGDPIQAVIRGLGVASDGRGRSLWAPRKEGQVEAIRRAYSSPAEMADLQYLEAHSTATQLGDATEIASIAEALKDSLPANQQIPITSVKANIGHALESAGLASLIKTVLCMQKGLIPPAINVEQLNPNIDWDKAPVRVVREATPWPPTPPDKPRRAGVNAFGIGGLNVHVVLDSCPSAEEAKAATAIAPQPASAEYSTQPSEPSEDAVAIIGRGCLFAGAPNVAEFWDLVRSGRDPKSTRDVRQPPDRGADSGKLAQRGGYVRDFHYDWRRHKIPPKQIEHADPLQFMVLEATDQALGDSGYDQKPFDRKRTGVVVGTEFSGDFTFRLQTVLRLPYTAKLLHKLLSDQGMSPHEAAAIVNGLADAIHARWPVLADETGSFSASSLAVRITKTWNLQGGAAAVDSGHTSAMSALSAAVDLLLAGDCDLMICVGAQRSMNPGAYEALSKAGLLAPAPSSSGPFDRCASGYLPGEGACVFLLKRLSDARRDGDPIRAVIRGLAAVHDDPAHALALAAKDCFPQAQNRSQHLAIVMTDACGVPANDEQLARSAFALRTAVTRDRPLWLASVVGQIGHTGGASGFASLLAASLAVEHGAVPGTFGLQTPLATLGRASKLVKCGNRAESIRPAAQPTLLAGIVLSQEAGLAHSALIEAATPVAPTDQAEEINSELETAPVFVAGGHKNGTVPLCAPTMAHRSILRTVESPLPSRCAASFCPAGAVLILGENQAAQILQRHMEDQGAVVYRLAGGSGTDAVLAEMDQFLVGPAIRTVFLMAALDPEAQQLHDAGSWHSRRQRGVELPYLVLQKWRRHLVQNHIDDPCVLAAATLLGGDLGLAGPIIAPEGGWVAGLLKSLHIEWNRRRWPTVVKICDFGPSDSPEAIVEAMLRELASDCPEVEVGLGSGHRRIVRPLASPVGQSPRIEPQPGATWLVTGGARGITAEVAIKLGRDYSLDLHLIGRSAAPRADAPWRNCSEEKLLQIKRSIVRQAIAEGRSPEKQWDQVRKDIEIYNNLERMRKLGLRVRYHSCDVSDWTALDDLLQTIRQTSGPITGIIHGAGWGKACRFENRTHQELAVTIGAKVQGTLALMNLTRDDPLRYFVGFGSISGRFGGNGLADYAAANDMLAKLCGWFRIGRPDCASTCIDWQSWDEVGMAMLPDNTVGARDMLKLKFMPPSEGVEHLKQELRAGLREREVLIDDGEFGQLVRSSDRQILPVAGPKPKGAGRVPAPAIERAQMPLAIIGMACRLPGAENLGEFWRLLIEGRSAVAEVPSDRLDQSLYYDSRPGARGKTYSKLAATLPHKQIDYHRCSIPEELTRSVDSTHLLMCETAASACRHAGLDPFDLPLRNTGVFVGQSQGSRLLGDCAYATYLEEATQFLREVQEIQHLSASEQDAIIAAWLERARASLPRHPERGTRDLAANMVAGTIAKAFGLSGPFMAIDSACASSLQAVLLASRALQFGQIDMAIVGGCAEVRTESLLVFAKAQAMSASQSRPFDTEADGLLLGEGYVAIALKTLERALSDGDPIQAVVRGLGVSSDGRGKSLWAPRKQGQIQAIRRAYQAGVEMADVQYIEAHATATQVGDATELAAVGEAMRESIPIGRKIPITSLKANMGHLLEAAGLAGLIKTVLCMQHRMIAPAINVRQLNAKIDWDATPLYVPQVPEPWPEPPAGKPRRAGINAFGIGGLNMHVVVDEFRQAARGHLGPSPCVAGLSPIAKSSDGDAVAVIGMGCVLPGAPNVPSYWELLITGRDPKRTVPPDRWRSELAYQSGARKPFRSPACLGGFITDFVYDWRAHRVPPRQITQADPLQFMVLEAADQALRDAGLDTKSFDRSRTGVVVGTEFGGDFAHQLLVGMRLPEMARMLTPILTQRNVSAEGARRIHAQFADVLLSHWPALVDESGSFNTSVLASRISKTWDFGGGATTIDGAETSSMGALLIAVNMLLSRDCDLMVCAGGQRKMDLPTYEELSLGGLLSLNANPAAPFDAKADGFVPGEGAGVLLLKRLSDARRDGNPVRAVIRGIGVGHGQSWETALRAALRRSFEASDVSPSEVVAVEADGLAQARIDEELIQAMLAVYGASRRRQPLMLGSVVGQIGHTLGASGIASMIKAILALDHLEIPPTVGMRSPLPAMVRAPGLIRAATQRCPLVPAGRVFAGVISAARMLAYHVLLERGTTPG